MNTNLNIKQTLTAILDNLVGKGVTVTNESYDNPSSGPGFNLHGTLEAPDEDGLYYLRVKECYEGSSGISFPNRAIAVDGVERKPSGRWVITLRG